MKIELLAYIVPRAKREEWLAEWRGELAFLADAPAAQRELTRGAWRDAAALRFEAVKRSFAPGAPIRLLAALAGIACACAAAAAVSVSVPGKGPAFVFLIAIVLLILPATMQVSRGDYSAVDNRGRRGFYFAKLALVLTACYFAWCAALPHVKNGAVHATMIGCVVALRWAILEQRRRCPVCSHTLRQPVRVGQPSYTLLGWSGIEWICTRGHGVLHEPIAPTTSFRRHTWSRLFTQ
jgi:hypothetical protein